jgi:glyoxylase-like metal-dependent hydrolase (beta-lactamase superfamily II)/rhodanese-related sulfurtransferase
MDVSLSIASFNNNELRRLPKVTVEQAFIRPKGREPMIFEQIATGGCQSYLVGCPDACAAVLIDPELRQIDRYLASAARDGMRIRYIIDTHTHADHFSAAHELGLRLDVPVVVHALAPAPYASLRINDGDMLAVGNLRLQFIHTPGHTRDSTCIHVGDRLFTGDTLLIGGTGRTDLPTGDANALYDSLFNGILQLDPDLKVFPAHDYKNQGSTTLAREIASNPRLQKRDRASFVEMMNQLNIAAPTHLTEALRTNMTGGKTVAQLLAEAAAKVPFMSLTELGQRIGKVDAPLVVLDVREKDGFDAAHVPGAKHLPRGQLELRINEVLPDPTARIVTVCEFGKISTLAAATLRDLGFLRAAALDGGMKAWRDGGFPVEPAAAPGMT